MTCTRVARRRRQKGRWSPVRMGMRLGRARCFFRAFLHEMFIPILKRSWKNTSKTPRRLGARLLKPRPNIKKSTERFTVFGGVHFDQGQSRRRRLAANLADPHHHKTSQPVREPRRRTWAKGARGAARPWRRGGNHPRPGVPLGGNEKGGSGYPCTCRRGTFP